MKPEVISIRDTATLGEAIDLFIEKRVGLLPVVDEQSRLVGLLALRDVLQLAFPSFIEMIEDYDFVHDFGALEQRAIDHQLYESPISEHMSETVSAESDTGLLRAEAMMRQHNIRDLPIVDAENRLVGLASWVDVGTAFLKNWSAPVHEE